MAIQLWAFAGELRVWQVQLPGSNKGCPEAQRHVELWSEGCRLVCCSVPKALEWCCELQRSGEASHHVPWRTPPHPAVDPLRSTGLCAYPTGDSPTAGSGSRCRGNVAIKAE